MKQSAPQLFILENDALKVCLTNFGAAVFYFQIREAGQWVDIALTCDTLEEFVENRNFYGATVGRVVNRIKKGRAVIGGKEYQLALNDGNNSAHGGQETYAWRLWDAQQRGNTVLFRLLSRDGEAGYPGNVQVEVEYRLEGNALLVTHRACSDQETIFNMTNHTYWCLDGLGEKIYGQELMINGDYYLEVREDLIPTGQVLSVKDTPFDFTSPRKIGDRIRDSHPMVQNSRGYDVSFVRRDRVMGLAARLISVDKRRVLEVETTLPDLHIYTGNFLSGDPGKGGIAYTAHDAICLEAERFPDAVNNSHFGDIFLKPDEKYEEEIRFHVSHF